jgi:hypothetical protein
MGAASRKVLEITRPPRTSITKRMARAAILRPGGRSLVGREGRPGGPDGGPDAGRDVGPGRVSVIVTLRTLGRAASPPVTLREVRGGDYPLGQGLSSSAGSSMNSSTIWRASSSEYWTGGLFMK